MKLGFANKWVHTTLTGMTGLLLTIGTHTALAVEKDTLIVKDTKAITKVLAKAPSDTGFKALDNDSNGKLTVEEAGKNPALADKFDQTDVNKDGAITVDEYAMFASKSSAKKDTAVN